MDAVQALREMDILFSRGGYVTVRTLETMGLSPEGLLVANRGFGVGARDPPKYTVNDTIIPASVLEANWYSGFANPGYGNEYEGPRQRIAKLQPDVRQVYVGKVLSELESQLALRGRGRANAKAILQAVAEELIQLPAGYETEGIESVYKDVFPYRDTATEGELNKWKRKSDLFDSSGLGEIYEQILSIDLNGMAEFWTTRKPRGKSE